MRVDFDIDGFRVINFVHLNDEDKESVRAQRNDDSIRRWMLNTTLISREEHANFLERLKKDDSNFYWVVKDQDGILGVISLNDIESTRKASIGIYANPLRRTAGSGKILMACLENIAFDKFHLETLTLEVFPGNERAISFYRKHGFREIGKVKQYSKKDSVWRELCTMELTRK